MEQTSFAKLVSQTTIIKSKLFGCEIQASAKTNEAMKRLQNTPELCQMAHSHGPQAPQVLVCLLGLGGIEGGPQRTYDVQLGSVKLGIEIRSWIVSSLTPARAAFNVGCLCCEASLQQSALSRSCSCFEAFQSIMAGAPHCSCKAQRIDGTRPRLCKPVQSWFRD